ncbi:MAG: hypothetical protein ACRD4X_11135 [Candidatus Acidiferrales bacterium]
MEDHFMQIQVIGIDLGKSVFHLVGMDKHGKVEARKRLSRSQMMVYTSFSRATRGGGMHGRLRGTTVA